MEVDWRDAETHTYVWDGDNIVLECIAFSNGTSRVCEYFWGPDMSGTEQGAGGVGGLLAESIDGVFQLPCHDHNGNVVRYVSESGAVAAEYVYDPYGDIAEEGGPLASAFTFGFSTKPLDRETGLVAYQRRFYRPAIGRWINRDPIEEEGGENLYGFSRNNPISAFDINGLRWNIIRDPTQNWATAEPTEIGDTFYLLSLTLHLDINEIVKWSNGTISPDSKPQVGCKYSIPNVHVFFTSRRKWHDPYVVEHYQNKVEKMPVIAQSLGYKAVTFFQSTSRGALVAAWETDGLDGFFFAGHGDKGALLLQKVPEISVVPNDVSPKYKLSIGYFYACESKTSNKILNNWQDYIAIDAGGDFKGFSGPARLWTSIEGPFTEQDFGETQ